MAADGEAGTGAPFDALLGLRLLQASGDRVVGDLPVTPDLHQVFGIVHGGVYCAVAESAAAAGATAWLDGRGRALGVANRTDFLRPVRDGRLRVEAVPVRRGRDTQLWEVSVSDERGRAVARSTVRLVNSV